jgi:hypothetical protein
MITTFVGVASVDITPSYPVMLGGFGQRITPSESVHDAIETVALCIGEDDPLLVITADLISMAAPVTKEVVEQIQKATGIDSTRILLAASHTHSAPVPHDPSGTAIGVQRFSEQLTLALVKVGIDAFHARRPARLVSGYGDARIGFNRWKPTDVQEVDTRIPVLLAIDSQSDSPFAVLFGSGCHPTTMGWDNPEVSADYPGEAKRFIRKALPGVTPLFINTTEGDIVPTTSPQRDALDPRGYCNSSFDDTQKIGAQLAGAVIGIMTDLSDDSSSVDDGFLGMQSSALELLPNNGGLDDSAAEIRLAKSIADLKEFLGADFQSTVPMSQLWAAASQVVIALDMSESEMRRIMIACCYYLGLTARKARPTPSTPINFPIQVLVIDTLKFLAMPGEVLVALGRRWSELIQSDRAFVIGLANTSYRYLPMREHFEEKGGDERYETVTAGVAPGEIDRVLEFGSKIMAGIL